MDRFVLGAVTFAASVYAGYQYSQSIDQGALIDRLMDSRHREQLLAYQLQAESEIYKQTIDQFNHSIGQLNEYIAHLEGCVQGHLIRESVWRNQSNDRLSDSSTEPMSDSSTLDSSDSEAPNNQVDTTDDYESDDQLIIENKQSIKQSANHEAERKIQRKLRLKQ